MESTKELETTEITVALSQGTRKKKLTIQILGSNMAERLVAVLWRASTPSDGAGLHTACTCRSCVRIPQ